MGGSSFVAARTGVVIVVRLLITHDRIQTQHQRYALEGETFQEIPKRAEQNGRDGI